MLAQFYYERFDETILNIFRQVLFNYKSTTLKTNLKYTSKNKKLPNKFGSFLLDLVIIE